MKWKTTILEAQPNRELRWRGTLTIDRLFTGEYIFIILPLNKNRVQFIHR
ncbi:hypothetical protein PN465_16930 [Nodularia spumigena CS-584]|uniref:Uncharacterized protein n=1 Tax=Nodularia spumigena UHCC 0060 TaxID=3110300 RepID=A0ABU5URE8_NODSP|nr:hypothetical protein [Nodularia spumigena]AHJ26591.1 hypothetical protein NSP_2360 [Nodularia spumigena CCY9414]MDB9383887.1 hypothetical protein [Nodularia spumigena CS-584]MEA5524613.1 hypothetical protein [Nodularia spumigena UHCC 0143]MEA5608852.1 hypothetical protein [Nodularia spumigena UHCC 0060]MEA5615058.1 hypothetical protein [Nodularia spumigena UHCC 0040]